MAQEADGIPNHGGAGVVAGIRNRTNPGNEVLQKNWLAASMNSLEFFRSWSWNGSLGAALVLYYGLKLMSICTVAQVCMLLSELSQKNQSAILLCTGVLLILAALAAIGSDAAAMVSLLMPVATVENFHQAWPFLLTTLVGAGTSALSWYLWVKRYRS